MKKSFIFLLSLMVLAFFSCGPQQQTAEQEAGDTLTENTETQMTETTAVAQMNPASGSNVQGTATFTSVDNGVRMNLELTGLDPNGTHALHLHETGDCSAPDASSAGGHWNPTDEQHGHRSHTEEFHRGDVTNLQSDAEGRVSYEVTVDDWTIGGEEGTNIIGKSVIVHAQRDDFQSQPSGDAGARISCGVIQQQ